MHPKWNNGVERSQQTQHLPLLSSHSSWVLTHCIKNFEDNRDICNLLLLLFYDRSCHSIHQMNWWSSGVMRAIFFLQLSPQFSDTMIGNTFDIEKDQQTSRPGAPLNTTDSAWWSQTSNSSMYNEYCCQFFAVCSKNDCILVISTAWCCHCISELEINWSTACRSDHNNRQSRLNWQCHQSM